MNRIPIVPGTVFISYSHLDLAYVRKLAGYLEQANIKAWFDEEIVTGERWVSVIRDQIASCSAMIAVMTPAAEESVWVDRELAQADALARPILPLLLDGNVFFRLANLQYELVSGGQMPSRAFVDALRAALSRDGDGDGGPALDPRVAEPSSRALDRVSPLAPLMGKEAQLLGHNGVVSSVAWAPDGQFLATATDNGMVCLWNPDNGQLIRRLQTLDSPISDIAWTPDGANLAVAGDGPVIRVLRAESLEVIRSLGAPTGRSRAISLSWSPDGHELAAGYGDGKLNIWNPTASVVLYQVLYNREATETPRVCVRWSPNSDQLAISYRSDVLVADSGYGRMIYEPSRNCSLAPHVGDVTTMAWAPNGSQLATSCADSRVRVWWTTIPLPQQQNLGHEAVQGQAQMIGAGVNRVNAVAWSPTGAHIASACEDGSVVVWSAHTGEKLLILKGHAATGDGSAQTGAVSLSWSPDGWHLASGGVDHTVRIWEISD